MNKKPTLKKKIICSKCSYETEYKKFREVKATVRKRINYPFGKNSQGRTTLTHKGCGGVFVKNDLE